MTVTFDTSAWIEYFSGSDLGRIVKGYIDGSETVFTQAIDLLEIKNKYQRENRRWKSRIDFICERSVIVDLNINLALLAADMKNKYGLYSIDAIIYATAQTMKSKLITKDKHFKDLKDVILLE